MSEPGLAHQRAYWDGWYADMADRPARDLLHQRHLGLPDGWHANNTVPWWGIGEIGDLLGLGRGDVLLDLACGRGAISVELARRAGGQVVGVDLSPVALRSARAAARAGGVEAAYAAAPMAATGLRSGFADAAVCIDSAQFAGPGLGHELFRVLSPGAGVALTCWRATRPDDPEVPAKIRDLDLRAQLEDAGFKQVSVTEPRHWEDAERAMWREAAALDPGEDHALRSMHEEGVRAVAREGRLRRVLISARR